MSYPTALRLICPLSVFHHNCLSLSFRKPRDEKTRPNAPLYDMNGDTPGPSGGGRPDEM